MQKMTAQDAAPIENIPEYNAQRLTQNGQLAKILLDEKCYYLRITRQGKLILTK
jgi:hemin uptake protein HemP